MHNRNTLRTTMYNVTGVRGAQVKGNTNPSLLLLTCTYWSTLINTPGVSGWGCIKSYGKCCLQLSLDSSFKDELESKAIENTYLAHPLTKCFGCKYKMPCVMTHKIVSNSVSKTTFKPEEHSYIHNDDAAEGGGCVGFPSCLYCRTDWR